MVESTREIADKIERETRFYITSLVWLASQLGPVTRSHWAIENSLHWVMDMIFRDDECRIRTDHAPANFTTIKHMAQNLIRKAPGKERRLFIGNKILLPNRAPPVNPERTEIRDAAALTAEIKTTVRAMGADIVGVADYDHRFAFTQAGEVTHKHVVVFGIGMSYDHMADIGPRSQDEVHRVYYQLDDIGVRLALAQQIAAYGYSAAMQPNEGDIPLVALAYLAGLGELGNMGR